MHFCHYASVGYHVKVQKCLLVRTPENWSISSWDLDVIFMHTVMRSRRKDAERLEERTLDGPMDLNPTELHQMMTVVTIKLMEIRTFCKWFRAAVLLGNDGDDDDDDDHARQWIISVIMLKIALHMRIGEQVTECAIGTSERNGQEWLNEWVEQAVNGEEGAWAALLLLFFEF